MENIYVTQRTFDEKDGCKVIEELCYSGTVRADGSVLLNAYVKKRMVERNQSSVSKNEHHKAAA